MEHEESISDPWVVFVEVGYEDTTHGSMDRKFFLDPDCECSPVPVPLSKQAALSAATSYRRFMNMLHGIYTGDYRPYLINLHAREATADDINQMAEWDRKRQRANIGGHS